MAVFEYSSPTGNYHRLYIPAVNASNFDLIVNYCDNARQLEFVFDEIDYSRLLKRK